MDLLRICLAPSATPAASPCQWPYVAAAAACGAMPFLSLVVKTQVGANSNFYFRDFFPVGKTAGGKGAQARRR